jgi:hypothetical protein
MPYCIQVQKYLADALCTGDSTGAIKYKPRVSKALHSASCRAINYSLLTLAPNPNPHVLMSLSSSPLLEELPFRKKSEPSLHNAGRRRVRSAHASSCASTTSSVRPDHRLPDPRHPARCSPHTAPLSPHKRLPALSAPRPPQSAAALRRLRPGPSR